MSSPTHTTAMRELRTDATDPRERGALAGEALREQIEQVEQSYLRLFAALRGWGLDDVLRFGAVVLGNVGRWRPALASELEGLAAGSGRRLELVAALNGRTEVIRLNECSTVGRTDGADAPWLAQNWDWYLDAPERTILWNAAADDDGTRFLTMTEAGLLAKVGVSSRGLALSLNMLAHRDDDLPPKIPVHLVLREILATCADVEDVAALLADVEFSASSAMTVVDARGGAASFEASPAGVARVDPTDGWIVHTNHFLDRSLAAGDENANIAGSRARLESVAGARPETLVDARRALSDHSCSPQAVCRHDEPYLPGFPHVGTVVSRERRPATLELEVAAGTPCSAQFVPSSVA